MSPWDEELAELEQRLAFADAMGGEEGVARQHKLGKLTARERIAALADPGSFRQFGALRGEGTYDGGGHLEHVLPRGHIDGMALIDGRKVVVTAGDFTVRGGSGGSVHGGLGEETSAAERAMVWQLPYVRL